MGIPEVIRLVGERAPRKPEHARIDVIEVNILQGHVIARGHVGYFVDAPDGGRVLVPLKPRDEQLELDAAAETYIAHVLRELAGGDKFAGQVEAEPAGFEEG